MGESRSLLKDGERVSIQLIRMALGGDPRVRFTTNRSSVLRLAAEQVPNIILLGVESPGEGGFHLPLMLVGVDDFKPCSEWRCVGETQ